MMVEALRGVPRHATESLENLDCLGLRFACFHGGQGEYRVVKRRIKSPPLDFTKVTCSSRQCSRNRM